MSDREIRLSEWTDGWHWTVFDANPDFQSSQVVGTLVPYAIAERREPSQIKALRSALIAAGPVPVGTETKVLVPLAVAMAWAVTCKVDHEPAYGPEERNAT